MKLLTIIGTRPEAVKMAPVLRKLEVRQGVTSLICATGQHEHLFDAPLAFAGLRPDYRLNLMQDRQQPTALHSRAMFALESLLAAVRPDRVIVHGDTSSAVSGALAAYGRAIPVAHVEAGLRTHRLDNPWPEEGYRRAIDAVADQLFAPTPLAASNLREEQASGAIFLTGNSGIDALHDMLDALCRDQELLAKSSLELPRLTPGKPVVLATLHRRESIGAPLAGICEGLGAIARAGAELIVTLHPNPEVRKQLTEALADRPGIRLIPPLSHPAMVLMMQRADLIVTDSGGVQEEAPSLGTPVLVAREVTERPEGVDAGVARLVACCPDRLVAAARAALAGTRERIGRNPYGDGAAADRIVKGILGEAVQPFVPQVQQASAPLRLVG